MELPETVDGSDGPTEGDQEFLQAIEGILLVNRFAFADPEPPSRPDA